MFSVLTLLALLCVGCSPCRGVITHQRDSVHVELRPRTITLRDTVFVELSHHTQRVVVSEEESFLSNPYATSYAAIRPTGELYHTLESTPQSLPVGYETRVELRDSIIYESRVEVRVVEVERKLSWWQRLQIRGFWIMFAALGGVILLNRII